MVKGYILHGMCLQFFSGCERANIPFTLALILLFMKFHPYCVFSKHKMFRIHRLCYWNSQAWFSERKSRYEKGLLAEPRFLQQTFLQILYFSTLARTDMSPTYLYSYFLFMVKIYGRMYSLNQALQKKFKIIPIFSLQKLPLYSSLFILYSNIDGSSLRI